MKIAFNPSTVAALTTPPNNKDITFDLRGRNIFARGVKFCGTDTWRDIKINNVSIGSNILDLRNGSNTTLTNTNGVVTINSTWRPVVDNLTSDSTTSSLSAKQGKVLAGLINTLSTNISNLYALRDGSNATGRWRGGLACFDVRGTNYAPSDLNMGLELLFLRNNTNNLKDGGEYNGVFSFRQWASGSDWSGGKAHLLSFTDNGNIWHRTSSGDDSWGTWKKLAYSTDIPSSLKNPHALTISLNGTSLGPYDGSSAKNINITPSSIGAATSGHTHDDRYYTKAESNAKYITDITTSVNKLTFTKNGSNIDKDIKVNVVYSLGDLTNISNKNATTKASSGLFIYNSYALTIGTNMFSSVLSINTGGTIQIAGNWGDDLARNLYWRSLSDRDVSSYPWKSWRTILDSENTYVSNNKGYINNTEITLVNNSDKVDNRHAISTTPNTGIIYKAAIYTSSSLTSYWVRLASIPSISLNGEFIATIHVLSGHSNPGRSAILLVYLRGSASSFMSKSFKICGNSNYDPNRFRLYYKDSDKTSEIWYQTTGLWDGIITTIISLSSEGSLYEGLTLYSGSITAVQTPSMSTYLSALVSTITDNISGNASTATKLQTSRLLWGQSFDGTRDISGSIHIVSTGGSWNEGIRMHIAQNSWCGLVMCGSDNTGTSGTSAKTWSMHNNDGKFYIAQNGSNSFTNGISCVNGTWAILSSDNVGIGTTSPAYKLHVNGTLGINNIATFNINNSWLSPSVLLIGRLNDSKDASKAIIGVTDGNLHIDAYHNKELYLNYYNKGKIKLGYQTGSYYISENGSYYSGTAASANNASTATNTQNVRIDQYASTGEYPIIWADSTSSNANSNTISRLYKTWKYLYWTPNKKTLTLAGNGTKCAIGSTCDTLDRPGLHITGNYPELIMMSLNVSNTNHGSIIVLGAYNSSSDSETNYRAFAIGMSGTTTSEAFLDFGYGINMSNPHSNGINNYGGGSFNNPYIMRLTASKRVFIQGIGDNLKPALLVNTSRNDTWVYTASFLSPNLTNNHNNAIFIGKNYGYRNAFGLTHMHIGDGSVNNYAALEVWGVGNVLRWYYDRHSSFLHRADFSSLGSDASYMNSALLIREHGYEGAQANTWANAPRMSWHWSGRVQTQIGLGADNELHLSKDNFNHYYKLVYETGTWGINISGNAASATNTDTVDGYHASAFVKIKLFRFNQYNQGTWTKILTITINSTTDLLPVIAFSWIPSECSRTIWADFSINWRSNSPIFYAIWKGMDSRTLKVVNSSGAIWDVWVSGSKASWDPFGEIQVTYTHNITSYNGGNLGYSDTDPGGTICITGGQVNYATYAAKLATARTIWGQSFDGTGNVDGPIRVHYKSGDWNNYNEGIRLYGNGKDNSWSNIHFGCDPATTSGSHANQWFIGRNTSNQFGIFHGTNSNVGIIHITTNDNVGIGINSPVDKLDVNGNIWCRGALKVGSSVSNNYIAFYGNTGDAPGSFVTSFIGEHLWGGDESTELLLMKFNDVGNGISGTTVSGPGPDRIRHIAHAHVFLIMTDTSLGDFATMAATTAVETKLDITRSRITASVPLYLQSDLYVNGNIRATGNSYATHFYESSDKTLKKNIKSILSSTNIPKIREFDWKDTGEHSYGFIALELEELGYGCLVSEADGKKTVNYTATLALTVAKLLNLINIQNKKISNLTKELKALKYGRKKNS